MNKVRKTSAARRAPRDSRNYTRYVVNSNKRTTDKNCSAILEIETRNERSRTLREYEKQRDLIWAFLEED